MDHKILDSIEQHSKDEESFKALRKIFEKIERKRQSAERRLNLLEAAIRNDYDGIVITDLTLDKPGPRIVYVNEGFEKITGYKREEVMGQSPRILQGKKTDKRTLERLRDKLENGQSFFGRLVNYRKDGSEFVNQFGVHPLRDEEGNITHWVSYMHDITERKRAERNVVDTEIEFDELKQESKRTLVDADENGNIIRANRAFRDLVGYDHQELQQMKVWELLSEKFKTSLRGRFEDQKKKQDFENQSFRGIIRHKTGASLQVEINTRILNLKDRSIIRGDVKNITLQKRVLRQLQKRKEDFSRLFRNVTDFTYRLSKDDEGQFHFESLSENFPELTGYYGDEFIRKGGWQKLVHPEDIKKAADHLEVAFNGSSHTEIYRIAQGDEGYLTVLDYVQPLKEDPDTDEVTAVRGQVSTHVEGEAKTE
jgi:PAS domain S-box-containing protein